MSKMRITVMRDADEMMTKPKATDVAMATVHFPGYGKIDLSFEDGMLKIIGSARLRIITHAANSISIEPGN